MSWDSLGMYALVSGICWVTGAYMAFCDNRKVAVGFTGLGSLVFFIFIVGLWISLERPPMRTMGETRLWYSFFLSIIGLILYIKCKYKWILSFSTLMSLVFVIVNVMKPDIHSKTLMPALQSAWFVPHVIVYMFSYAMMGAVTLFSIYLWFRKSPEEASAQEMVVCDNLVAEGMGFTFFPETGLKRANHLEQLAFFTVGEPPLSCPLAAVYKKNSFLAPAARAFIDLTRSYYNNEL